MFSYALRQIQPRSASPSRARLPVTLVVDSTLDSSSSGEDDGCARIASHHLRERSRSIRARSENARPSLTGQERSGPAGRSVVTIIIITFFFFLLTNCTATSVLFINFYFCCYVCSITAGTCNVYTYACAGVYTCPRVKCLCPVCRSNGRVEDGVVIRVVSY